MQRRFIIALGLRIIWRCLIVVYFALVKRENIERNATLADPGNYNLALLLKNSSRKIKFSISEKFHIIFVILANERSKCLGGF